METITGESKSVVWRSCDAARMSIFEVVRRSEMRVEAWSQPMERQTVVLGRTGGDPDLEELEVV